MARQLTAISEALSAAAPAADVCSGTASGAITSMNWAAWDYTVACNRRLEIWRMQAGKKVDGSRRMIYDTRPASPYFARGKSGCEFSYAYGGAWTGRMGGKTNMTATMVAMQQQSFSRLLRPVQQKLTEFYSHAIDAMAYGAMMHKAIEKKRWVHDEFMWDWDTPRIKFRFYERTLRWQSNLTGSGPSVSDTLLLAQGRSRSDGNKSKHGWLSRMPSKFTT